MTLDEIKAEIARRNGVNAANAAQRQQAEERRAALMADLKEKFGVSSLEEAQELLTRFETRRDELITEITGVLNG